MEGIRSALIINLKRLRSEKGMSQAVLAERCGLSNGHIGEIESGNRFPSPETLEKIAKSFGVSAVSLLMSETDLRTLEVSQTLSGVADTLSTALEKRLADKLADRVVALVKDRLDKLP
jgi:transcriptional regulator with XRE-family HTH domain